MDALFVYHSGKGEYCDEFKPTTCLCLPHARSWISYNKSRVFFMFNGLWCVVVVCFVDIGGNVDYNCFNILFIICHISIHRCVLYGH
jgi:hypothetical protein